MSQDEDTDKRKQSWIGCLGIVAVILLVSIGFAVRESVQTPDTTTASVIVEINESMIGTLRLGGADCDMSGYDIEVRNADGKGSTSRNLGKGRLDSDGIFCVFAKRMDVPDVDNYSVFIPVHSGDTRIVSKSVKQQDALSVDHGLEIHVKWYNHRDAD